MENNDLNKRVLRRLEEKIAIEEYTKKHNTTPKKKKSFFKVACIIVAGVLIAGNFYTYATQNKDIVTYVLEKINLLNVVDVNDIQTGEKASLTLENYGFDENTLIIGYKLKIKDSKETFENNLFDSSRIIDGDKIYGLERAYSMVLDKISDTEYEVIASYNFDTSQISNNAMFETKIYLPKYLDVGEHIGEWAFEIPLDMSKKALNYEKYVVENKRTILQEIPPVEHDEHYMYLSASLLEVKKTDMVTKFAFILEGYSTAGEIYTVEILDENGEIILENNIQKLFGGVPTEIICRKLDLNQKITINISEISGDEVTAKGSLEVDLAKDLKEEEKREISYATKKWHNLRFKYNEDFKVDISKTVIDNIDEYFIRFDLCEYVGNYKKYEEFITLTTYEDKGTMTLEEMGEFVRNAEIVWPGAIAFQNSFPEYSIELQDFVYLNSSQILELVKNGEVIVNGIKIDTINDDVEKYDIRETTKYENIKTTKIKGLETITWTKTAGGDVDNIYMFIYKGNVYQLEVPANIVYKDTVEDFINNIELN